MLPVKEDERVAHEPLLVLLPPDHRTRQPQRCRRAGPRGLWRELRQLVRRLVHRRRNPGAGDGQYLRALEALLARMPRPKLAFVLAGGDVLAGDRLGRLALSIEGARKRDLKVARALTGVGSVWLPAGGYSALGVEGARRDRAGAAPRIEEADSRSRSSLVALSGDRARPARR